MSVYTPLAKAAAHFAMATVEGEALSDNNMDNVLSVAYGHAGQSFSLSAPKAEQKFEM